MSVPETHYVLIIHGTWNAPTPGVTKWYQKGGNFAEALAQRLENTPLAGAVWRSCAGQPTDLVSAAWSGDNTHEARLSGAFGVAAEMLAFRAADETARLHVIAHSHGGNVVLKALEFYFRAIEGQAHEIARHFTSRAGKQPDVARKEVLAAALREIYPHWSQARRDALGGAIAEQLAPHIRLAKEPIAATIRQCLRNDPQSHRIGRLVFLGTPFLHKRWARHKWRAWLRNLIIGIAFTPYAILAMYGNVLLWSAILAWPPFIDFVGFNPLQWPVWLQAALLIFACTSPFAYKEQRRDVNFYFAPPAKQDASAPLPALVVTAAQLDEALLGLSAEPLVDAHLRPEIDELTALHLRWRPRDRLAGIAWADLSGGKMGDPMIAEYLSVWTWFGLAVSNVMKLLAWPAYTATLRPLLRAYLRRSIRKLMLAHASGLPPQEFNSASLSVQPNIGVPEVFDEGKVWDVAELVAGEPSLLPSSVEKERYTFLWSPDALVKRLDDSRIWRWLDTKEYWSTLKRERGYSLNDEELLALKRACLVIEEKARELGGALHLSHSGYYGHPKIVDAIAAFLVTGHRPTDDHPVGSASGRSGLAS